MKPSPHVILSNQHTWIYLSIVLFKSSPTCCDPFTLTEASRCRCKTVFGRGDGGDARLARVGKIFFVLWRCPWDLLWCSVFTLLLFLICRCYRCCRLRKLVWKICGRVLLRRKVVRSIGGGTHIGSGRPVPGKLCNRSTAQHSVAVQTGTTCSQNLFRGVFNAILTVWRVF